MAECFRENVQSVRPPASLKMDISLISFGRLLLPFNLVQFPTAIVVYEKESNASTAGDYGALSLRLIILE